MKDEILIPIHPEWVELIASGQKTIEVRKTAPKAPAPFKCHIYCTKPKFEHEDFLVFEDEKGECRGLHCGGMVVGKFVCDRMDTLSGSGVATAEQLRDACLTVDQYNAYRKGRASYFLHISDLVIYDEPKKLSEFRRPCPESLYCESCAMWSERRGCGNAALQITRPPQSWCYVEELI